MNKSITAHVLVKNEEKFLWYAVGSVINQVDRVMLWDTGSTDGTRKIIDEITNKYQEKISFKEIGNVNSTEFTKIRQRMIDETSTDWILILDGDEIWWEESIKKIVEEIDKGVCDAIITPFVNVVGDIFHFQEEGVGKYKIDGKIGNITIRAFRKNIKGLKVFKDYGQEGFIDSTGEFIQKSKEVKRKFVNASFLHLTFLKRSILDKEVMQRSKKNRREIGASFPLDFYYPEVFFRSRPKIVPSVWKTPSFNFKLRAFIETPIRKIYRRTLLKNTKYGY